MLSMQASEDRKMMQGKLLLYGSASHSGIYLGFFLEYQIPLES